MKTPIKLTTIEINGFEVDFYKPPHDEPDLPWVNVRQLARAFVSNDEALNAVSTAMAFNGGKSTVTRMKKTGRMGSELPMIVRDQSN